MIKKLRKGRNSCSRWETENVSVGQERVHVWSIFSLVLTWLQQLIRLLRVWYISKQTQTVQSFDQWLGHKLFSFVLVSLTERYKINMVCWLLVIRQWTEVIKDHHFVTVENNWYIIWKVTVGLSYCDIQRTKCLLTRCFPHHPGSFEDIQVTAHNTSMLVMWLQCHPPFCLFGV